MIIRTAGEGKRWTYFVRDLTILLNQWREIQERPQPLQATHLPLHGARHYRAHRARLPHRDPSTRVVLIDDGGRRPAHDRMGPGVCPSAAWEKSPSSRKTSPSSRRFNIERQLEQTSSGRVPLTERGRSCH